MKSSLSVSSSTGEYEIHIGKGLLNSLPTDSVVLVDPNISKFLPPELEHVIEVPGNEESKTLLGCEKVILNMRENGVRRGHAVTAIGGGAIQDVATLSTSLYMRGVDWNYVPTTLMSMADSCIGGKSSINAGGIKNLVGNFHPPRKILIDPIFIETLPPEAITSGLSEAVKICFARGPEAFSQYLTSPASISPGNNEETALLIHHVLSSKKWFVEIDEFDKNERQLLNFGHSFGHAWEAACGFSVQHGIAVSVGMLAALNHPRSAYTEATLKLKSYCQQIVQPVLPQIQLATESTDWNVFRAALGSDKKNSSDWLRLILPNSNSELEIVEIPLLPEQLILATRAIQLALKEISND